jgi:hypothetical protein
MDLSGEKYLLVAEEPCCIRRSAGDSKDQVLEVNSSVDICGAVKYVVDLGWMPRTMYVCVL